MAVKSNYPNGFAHGVTIRGVPILNTYSGSVYYVDSVNGSNNYDGTYQWPKASISYLFSSDIVKAGDIVIAKPGHVETLAAALAWDIAGVCVIMSGDGTSKAYFNITATGGYVNVTGAGGTLINPKFVTGVDQVVRGVLVAAADFSMVNVEYHDAANKNSLIQVLTTSAANRFLIDGYRFFEGVGGTQKTDGIKTVGGDKLVFNNINITGDFSNAPINYSTAATNIEIDTIYVNNTNTGPQCAMDIHANTTGFAENVKARIDSGTTYVSSTAKIQWGALCQGYNTDGSGGAAIGSAVDIEAKVDSVGVNTSTLISQASSVGIQTSTTDSLARSVGIQTSTVDSRASVAVSTIASVGVQTSAAQSMVLSQAARTDSKADSVGIQTSVVNSLAQSVGIQTSAVGSQAASIAGRVSVAESKIDSTGLGVSTTISTVASIAARVSVAESKVDSVGLGVSTVHSKADSVGALTSATVSTNISKTDSVGLGVSTGLSQVASTGILANGASTGVSTVNSKVDSTAIMASNTISMLLSIATVISVINSKT